MAITTGVQAMLPSMVALMRLVLKVGLDSMPSLDLSLDFQNLPQFTSILLSFSTDIYARTFPFLHAYMFLVVAGQCISHHLSVLERIWKPRGHRSIKVPSLGWKKSCGLAVALPAAELP
jgi:hypothetical protein